MRIKRGTRLYYTTIGYKGFHYPSGDNSYLLSEEIEANPLTWITPQGDDRIPVAVTLPDDPARVVWVKKTDCIE